MENGRGKALDRSLAQVKLGVPSPVPCIRAIAVFDADHRWHACWLGGEVRGTSGIFRLLSDSPGGLAAMPRTMPAADCGRGSSGLSEPNRPRAKKEPDHVPPLRAANIRHIESHRPSVSIVANQERNRGLDALPHALDDPLRPFDLLRIAGLCIALTLPAPARRLCRFRACHRLSPAIVANQERTSPLGSRAANRADTICLTEWGLFQQFR